MDDLYPNWSERAPEKGPSLDAQKAAFFEQIGIGKTLETERVVETMCEAYTALKRRDVEVVFIDTGLSKEELRFIGNYMRCQNYHNDGLDVITGQVTQEKCLEIVNKFFRLLKEKAVYQCDETFNGFHCDSGSADVLTLLLTLNGSGTRYIDNKHFDDFNSITASFDLIGNQEEYVVQVPPGIISIHKAGTCMHSGPILQNNTQRDHLIGDLTLDDIKNTRN